MLIKKGFGIVCASICFLIISVFVSPMAISQGGEGSSEELPPGSYLEEPVEEDPSPSVNADVLRGNANINVDQSDSMPPFAPKMVPALPPQWIKSAPPPIQPVMPLEGKASGSSLKGIFDLGVRKDYGPIVRPDWIPAHAYTNNSMVAPYHNSSLMWWDKSAMPNRPQWVVLSTSVTRFWRGFSANPCWVLVAPNPLAPGNFTFRARSMNGPRGWLQAIPKKSQHGFPLYRYWLDQP